jgi:hypothetical protein
LLLSAPAKRRRNLSPRWVARTPAPGHQGGIETSIAQALRLVEAKQHCAPYLAALGLLLDRGPLYAGPETVVAPTFVARAYARKLESAGVAPIRTATIKGFTPIGGIDRTTQYGEPLPPGLVPGADLGRNEIENDPREQTGSARSCPPIRLAVWVWARERRLQRGGQDDWRLLRAPGDRRESDPTCHCTPPREQNHNCTSPE